MIRVFDKYLYIYNFIIAKNNIRSFVNKEKKL